MAAKRGRPYKEQAEDLREVKSLEQDILDIGEKQFGSVNRILGVTQDLAKVNQLITEDGRLREGVTKDQVKSALDQLKASAKGRDIIMDTFPGVFQMAKGAKQAANSFSLLAKSPMGILGIVVAIGAALVKVAGQVAETRKELGVSVVTAGKLLIANKALGVAAKGYGLTLDGDIIPAQNAILNTLGGSVDEAIKLSLSFARTAAATGQTSDELAGTLSLMESISGASREVLLNQIRSNAAMIEAAGVAPALVMRDLAQNAEFFASFAKDGGQNLIAAGTAARKLGLDMSAVASVTESLLDFETSIEKSMEASMLLGRSINTDRARMLAIQGDQVGVMKEILKQVGGEVEFNRLNVLQRRALAESVGVNVEQLSRLVRNNQASASGQITRADGATNMEKLQSVSNGFLESVDSKMGKLVRNTE
jgi:hypothetical protein|tara:strand:+ start:1084 stop:2352 length:1269 start_codon:yes stop_codon:yes gene_type:complete